MCLEATQSSLLLFLLAPIVLGFSSGVLLAGSGRFGGVVGAFAALLTVEDGGADAIAAALGASAAAVAVSGIDEAAAILAALKTEDACGGRPGDRRRAAARRERGRACGRPRKCRPVSGGRLTW